MRLKYGNKPQMIEGKRFASLREAGEYVKLRALESAGSILNLRCQVRYRLEVNGMLIGHYVADFVWEENGAETVADAKGMRTPVYKLKRALMKAVWGIDIVEL